MNRDELIKDLLERLDTAQLGLGKFRRDGITPTLRVDVERIMNELKALGWEQDKWNMYSELGNVNYRKQCAHCYYREIKEGDGEECLFMDEECIKCGSHVLIEPRPKNWKPFRPF